MAAERRSLKAKVEQIRERLHQLDLDLDERAERLPLKAMIQQIHERLHQIELDLDDVIVDLADGEPIREA